MQCNTQQVNFRPVLFPVSALSIRMLAQLGKFLTDGLRTAGRNKCSSGREFWEGFHKIIRVPQGRPRFPPGLSALRSASHDLRRVKVVEGFGSWTMLMISCDKFFSSRSFAPISERLSRMP